MMDRVRMNSKLLLFVIAGLIMSSYYANDIFAEEQNLVIDSTSWSEGKIKWLESSYPATGTGVVRVIDPDMNLNPGKVDNFDVDVWSDLDIAGIDLTVTETDDATGIFEGTVFFTTTDDTSGHRLRVMNGDTIYSKYEDNTLPDSHTKNKLDVIHTASIQGIPDSIIDDRISLDKKSYTWSDQIYVTIIAPEHNLDNDSIEKIDASEQYRVAVTTRHFEIADFQLVETGVDTGIFAGKIILSENEFYDVNSNGDDGISVIFEYTEDKVAIGSALIKSNQVQASPLKQQILGVLPTNVVCNDDLLKVYRHDGSAVCVTSNTLSKLMKRGWTNDNSDMIIDTAANTQKTLKTKGDEYCHDNFVISLSTPKKFYFPGDEVIISGIVNCAFNNKLTVSEDIPVTLQIVSNGVLIEVAQIEITSDGMFSHLVNAMGPQWQQSGTYGVKIFFDIGYVAETSFDFFADVDPRSRNELQVSRDLVLVGNTITVFGTISNPAAEYVIIRIFDENNNEMENIRHTLDDDDGFYEREVKIKSDWPVGTYSASIMPSEFDSVVYFDVLGTTEIWEETNKAIQNFP